MTNVVQIFLVLSLLQACATDKLLEVEKTYRKTLKFSVNGERASGTYSAKKKPSYRMEIYVPQKPNLVKLTSCHQEKIFVKPGKEIDFDYVPDLDIEAGQLPCLVEISVLEDSGRNQWGLIDFKLDPENLTARVHCNGEAMNIQGSSICQSRFGLIQSIEFDRSVKVLTPEGCDIINPSEGKKFYFNVTEGNCFYLFSDGINGMYRLVTFGYNEALVDD